MLTTTLSQVPMAALQSSELPSVSLSYANNFWGQEDAGVPPLLNRMLNGKITSDELKSFYSTRAALEDEYGRKLSALARKPLGVVELGTLRSSLEVARAETEQMGKAHQGFALKMRSDLEDPLTGFSGSLKERRKIVQSGIEKLLKTKMHQTVVVSKSRDRYEQECLKIKGYLAQGHMVMGQEERKNKAKLEKTQIQLSTTCAEYEAAVKVLEDTTTRWNREWKAACDKFQDLDEERINYMKTSLWAFANMTSTVCVSDDSSCEKMRLALEECDVEEDVAGFITESGTGQEIPDPPRFIDFCRGDVNDGASEASDEYIGTGAGNNANGGYSVAQFPRTANPAFQSSAPSQPIQSQLIQAQGQLQNHPSQAQLANLPSSPQKAVQVPSPLFQPQPQRPPGYRPNTMTQSMVRPESSSHLAARPTSQISFGDEHDPRERQLPQSGRYNQQQQPQPQPQPPQQHNQPRYPLNDVEPPPHPTPTQQKSRSSFFASPFRRKREDSTQAIPAGSLGNSILGNSSTNLAGISAPNSNRNSANANPQPVSNLSAHHSQDPDALPGTQKTQIAVGGNIFDVDAGATMRQKQNAQGRGQNMAQQQDEGPDYDPVAAALAQLKVSGGGGTPVRGDRNDRDRYDHPSGPHGNSTPGPGGLGVPEPAFTSRQMRMTKQRFVEQTGAVFGGANGHGGGSGGMPNRVPVGGRPSSSAGGPPNNQGGRNGRSPSPNGYNGSQGQQSHVHPPPSFGSNHHQQSQQPRHNGGPSGGGGGSGGHPQQGGVYQNAFNNLSQPALNSAASLAGRPRAQSSSPVKSRQDYDANSWGSRSGGPGPDSGVGAAGSGVDAGGYNSIGRSDGMNMSTALTRSRPTSPMPGHSGGGGYHQRNNSHYVGSSPGPGGGSLIGRDARGVSPGGGIGIGGHYGSQSRSPASHQPPPGSRGGGRPLSRAALVAAGGASPSEENMALAITPTRSRGYSLSQPTNPYHQQQQQRAPPSQHHQRQDSHAIRSSHQQQQSQSKPIHPIRPRSSSSTGRPVLHHSRAMHNYTSVIVQELTFMKGDVLAVLMKQDDGWWEAEIVQTEMEDGPNPPGLGEAGLGAIGLVPSNYLQTV